MKPTKLIDEFQIARRSKINTVIEGVQALKHAVRFNAEIQIIASSEVTLVEELLSELAPDVREPVITTVETVSEEVFHKLSPQPPRTKVIAIAKRRSYQLEELVSNKPLVILEDPKDLENIGAVIRVAAAADAAGVLITGAVDVWHPAIIRGSAALHFAVPVFNIDKKELFQLDRKLIALDPTGKLATKKLFPKNGTYLFGTERHGISKQLLEASDRTIRLPMKEGVSSLNLATSVAATLYRM